MAFIDRIVKGATTYEIPRSYTVYTTLDQLAWNTERRLGTKSGAFTVTLPSVGNNLAEEIRITFAASSNFTVTINAPTGVTAMGDYSISVTSGKIYEISCAVLDSTHIGIVSKEW